MSEKYYPGWADGLDVDWAAESDTGVRGYFRPANDREHTKALDGADVPDWCSNCDQPFMAHENGRCPATGN